MKLLRADADVDDAGAVVAELDAAALELAEHARQVLGVAHDRAGARVRHQAAAAEDAAEATDLAHLSAMATAASNSSQPPWICCDEIVDADVVGAGLARDPLRLARGEDEHAHRLAGAVRQHDRRAHRLVGLARIDPQPGVDLDRSRRSWRTRPP